MRTYLSLLLLLFFVGSGRASAQQPFETFFRDSTLRLDYILTGASRRLRSRPTSPSTQGLGWPSSLPR